MRFIDIGANMVDLQFQGVYHGHRVHDPDLPAVLQRAYDNGVSRIIITASTLEETRRALKLSETDHRLFTTVGVHPTRCNELYHDDGELKTGYWDELLQLAQDGSKIGKIVAVGECGLDFDRLFFCPRETQLKGFEKQFELAKATGLPMFLHNRNTDGAFIELIRKHRDCFSQGVVHSFTDSITEAENCMAEGLYIGLNGCSFKTEVQVETVRQLPLERLMLETDAPWCDVRRTHAGHKYVFRTTFPTVKKEKWQEGSLVRGRSEPCMISAVAEMLAGVKQIDLEKVERQCWENTLACFEWC